MFKRIKAVNRLTTSMIFAALRRKGQGEREMSIRSYFMSPGISKLIRRGIFLCAVGLILLFPFALSGGVNAYITSKYETRDSRYETPSRFDHEESAVNLSKIIAVGGGVLFGAGVIATLIGKLIANLLGPAPTTDEVLAWRAECVARVCRQAQARLGFTQEETAGGRMFEIVSPVLWLVPGVDKNDIFWRIDEGVGLFGLYKTTVVILVDRNMGVYTSHLNFVKDITLSDHTHEFHYQDIVSFSTAEEATSYKLPTGQKLKTSQKFSLAVSSGESIELGEETALLGALTGDDSIPTTGAETAISVIRVFVRDKKEAMFNKSEIAMS